MTISIGNDPLPPQPGECCPDCAQPVLWPGRCPDCAAAEQKRERKIRSVAKSIAKIVSEGRCRYCGGPLGDLDRRFCPPCRIKVRRNSNAYRLRRTYDLSEEEALALRQQPCGICGAFGDGVKEGLNDIDHCHVTGRVRGALCSKHNKGLGHMGNDPTTLRAAAEYLERHGSFGTLQPRNVDPEDRP